MKKYVVVDIDGTISNLDHRLNLINSKTPNWEEFYLQCSFDSPIPEIINLVKLVINSGYTVVFCTGRPDYTKDITLEWLSTHLNIDSDYITLLMRKTKDHRQDYIIKPELLSKYNITPENTEFILDDRDSVVKKFRELGFKVLQVANGNY